MSLRPPRTIARRGSEFEREFFGLPPATQLTLRQKLDRSLGVSLVLGDTPRYLNYRDSMIDCFLNQPAVSGRRGHQTRWNPFRPQAEPAKTLLYWTTKRFSEREKANVGIYCAVSQALDLWHGVDGVVFYGDIANFFADRSYRRYSYLTFDLSTHDKPVKSDLLITREDLLQRNLRQTGLAIGRYLRGEMNLRDVQTVSRSWADTTNLVC